MIEGVHSGRADDRNDRSAASRRLSGLDVGTVGLGGASWSIPAAIERSRALRTIHAALDGGVRLIDTAHAYTTRGAESHNEQLIAAALRGRSGGDVLVATKAGHERKGDDFPIDGRPDTIRRQCEASLRALELDCIDLYQLHWPDPLVPLAETLGAFGDLRDAGKIRFIGLANVTAAQLEEAVGCCDIASVQNPLSPFWQENREVLERCAAMGLLFLAYSPLGGSADARRLDRLAEFVAVAKNHDVSAQRVALAWELAQSPVLLPIPGATRPETAADAAAAATLALDSAELAMLTSCVDRVAGAGTSQR